MSKKRWTKTRIVGQTLNPFRAGPALVIRDEGEPEDSVNIVIPAEPGMPVPLGAKMGDFRAGAEDDELEYKVSAASGQRAMRGPIQVSTPRYRTGWESTFGKRGVN